MGRDGKEMAKVLCVRGRFLPGARKECESTWGLSGSAQFAPGGPKYLESHGENLTFCPTAVYFVELFLLSLVRLVLCNVCIVCK